VGVGAAPGVGSINGPRCPPRPWLAASGVAALSVTAPIRSGGTRPPAPDVTASDGGRHQRQQGGLGPAAEPHRIKRRRADAAETCNCVRVPTATRPWRATGPGRSCDDRAVERQAELAAVSVAGHHQLVTVGREAIQHPRFGRMRQPSVKFGGGVGRSGDGVVAVLDRCGSSTPARAIAGPRPRDRGGYASCPASRAR